MSQQDTEDGIKWIEALVFAIADELGIQLDGLPDWDMTRRLNPKMAVQVAGRRKIQTFWRSDIDDSQGVNQPAHEIRAKLLAQIREFMETFAPPKKRIGF